MKNGYENFIKCFTWAVRETEDPNALYIPYTLGSMIFHILFIQFSLFFIPPISGLPPFDLLPIHRHTPPSSSHFNNSTKASYKLLAEEQYVTGYRSLPAIYARSVLQLMLTEAFSKTHPQP